MSHRAVLAILDDFELHKDDVLERLRRYFTPAYFAILTRLMDRQLQVEAPSVADWSEAHSDAEVSRLVGVARATLNAADNPRAALADLDRLLLSLPAPETAPPSP